jgi:hypothetical protein
VNPAPGSRQDCPKQCETTALPAAGAGPPGTPP